MDTGLFYMLHHTADQHPFAVTYDIDVHLNRQIEKTVQQNRTVI